MNQQVSQSSVSQHFRVALHWNHWMERGGVLRISSSWHYIWGEQILCIFLFFNYYYQKKRPLPSAGSLPKCPEVPGLQLGAQSWSETQLFEPLPAIPLVCISKKLELVVKLRLQPMHWKVGILTGILTPEPNAHLMGVSVCKESPG